MELPRDHDATDVMQAWARAQSTDPVYLGVLYQAEGEASFEDHIGAAQTGTEADASRSSSPSWSATPKGNPEDSSPEGQFPR